MNVGQTFSTNFMNLVLQSSFSLSFSSLFSCASSTRRSASVSFPEEIRVSMSLRLMSLTVLDLCLLGFYRLFNFYGLERFRWPKLVVEVV